MQSESSMPPMDRLGIGSEDVEPGEVVGPRESAGGPGSVDAPRSSLVFLVVAHGDHLPPYPSYQSTSAKPSATCRVASSSRATCTLPWSSIRSRSRPDASGSTTHQPPRTIVPSSRPVSGSTETTRMVPPWSPQHASTASSPSVGPWYPTARQLLTSGTTGSTSGASMAAVGGESGSITRIEPGESPGYTRLTARRPSGSHAAG